MKFFAAALLALVAGSADAKIGRELAGKRVDQRKLMKAAVKVDPKTLRRLDQNQQQQFQITGEHSIRFNRCTSLTTEAPDEDVMFGDFLEYTQNKKVVAEKSYILFNVCESAYCDYYGEEEAVYMVDLATYMNSLSEYLPTQRKNYCDACLEAQESCQAVDEQDDAADDQQQDGQDQQDNQDGEQQDNQDGEQQDNQDGDQQDNQDGDQQDNQDGEQQDNQDGEQQDNQDGEQQDNQDRKLADNNGQNWAVVDCDVCANNGCFEEEDDGNNNNNNNDEQEVNDETIGEWVAGIAECQETGAQWNNYDLYAGFICNAAGTGVEIGVFLDDECSIYTSAKKFSNLAAQEDLQFYQSSQEIVTYPFVNKIDCAEETQYITPDEYDEMMANGEDQNQDNNNNGEAAEANGYCQGVFDEQAVPIEDCNQNGEEDYQDDEVEEQAENNYDWYAYTLSQDDAEDNQAVCKVLQTMEGEYSVVYDSDEEYGSGSFYDYAAAQTSGKAVGGGMIALIVIGLVAVIAAVAFMANTSKKAPKESLLSH